MKRPRVKRWPAGLFSHLPQPSHLMKTGEGLDTNAFWAEKWISFLADTKPCLFTDFSSSRCFLEKRKGGRQLHHSYLAQSVKYVCAKCLKCMLAIQQTRMAQLEKSKSSLFWLQLYYWVTSQVPLSPSPLAPGPRSECALHCKFLGPDSLIRSE